MGTTFKTLQKDSSDNQYRQAKSKFSDLCQRSSRKGDKYHVTHALAAQEALLDSGEISMDIENGKSACF